MGMGTESGEYGTGVPGQSGSVPYGRLRWAFAGNCRWRRATYTARLRRASVECDGGASCVEIAENADWVNVTCLRMTNAQGPMSKECPMIKARIGHWSFLGP